MSRDKGVNKLLGPFAGSSTPLLNRRLFVRRKPVKGGKVSWVYTQTYINIYLCLSVYSSYRLILYLVSLYTCLLCAFAADDKPSQIRITHQLLMNALRETRPSVTASERQRYDRMQVIYILLRYPCPT